MGQILRHNHYTDPLWTGFYQAQLQNLKTLVIYMKRGNIKVVRDFIRERHISEKSYRDYPSHVVSEIAPVEAACRTGNIEALKALIDIGFSPHGVSCTSPINIACSHGYLRVVQLLVETYNVSIKAADKSGITPLLSAVEGNALNVFMYLIEKGLDIKSLHRHSDILHVSAQRGHAVMCQKLLQTGLDVNRRNTNGDTPLKLAAINLHHTTCFVLLKAGADVGCVLLCDITKRYVHRNVRKQTGPRYKDYEDTVRLLIRHGANPNVQDSDGNTSLHLIHSNLQGVIFLVCEMNVILDKKNSRNMTPFMLGFRSHTLCAIMKMLVDAGYTPGPKEWALIKTDPSWSVTPGRRNTLKHIEEAVTNPKSLKELCCFQLRRKLGTDLPSKVEFLGLPNRLENMVMLRHRIPESVCMMVVGIR